MKGKIILYFDQAANHMKEILNVNKPEGYHLLFWHDMNDKEKQTYIERAEYLMVAAEQIDRNIITQAKQAKLIQKTGVGVDNIDLESAKQQGIHVSNTPGANATAVAEMSILLILALYRKLPYLNRLTKQGEWLMWKIRHELFELKGKTHGVIGFGKIGQEVAKLSKAFGTNILYYDANKEIRDQHDVEATFATFHDVLNEADIVSVHVPFIKETKNLISTAEFRMMKENAILVNVARGGIVDEHALYEALQNGEIAGAGMDVWNHEPINENNPLLKLDNVIATPHIGAGTVDTLHSVLQIAFNNILHVSSGKEPNHIVE